MSVRRLAFATPILVAAVIATLHPWAEVSAGSPTLLRPGSDPWPPVDPDDIVNVHFDELMSAGHSVTVYSVPAKQHLVVTQVALANGSGGFDAQLVQRGNHGSTVKLTSLFSTHSTFGIGIAFEPGSSLDVTNTRISSDRVVLDLFGYLAPSKAWPPVKPADIVDTTGTASLAFGETYRIFDVPADRWLVINSNDIRGSGEFVLLEDYAGTQTRKPLNDGKSHLVGIAFRPGSSVVLRNDVQFGNTAYRWLFTGYLAR